MDLVLEQMLVILIRDGEVRNNVYHHSGGATLQGAPLKRNIACSVLLNPQFFMAKNATDIKLAGNSSRKE